MRTVTFRVGQTVRWPYAYLQVAQVDELRRTCVRLVYGTRRGHTRYRVIPAADLAAIAEEDGRRPGASPLLPLHNPLGRGVLARAKTYTIAAPAAAAEPQGRK